ncbi:hypothetical protein DFS33DRAFT_1269049 [Desarmillaria ectypa]|nr:hypothetical protein DFS33DRAFT_1269049 [Desarmillaria ectypa]
MHPSQLFSVVFVVLPILSGFQTASFTAIAAPIEIIEVVHHHNVQGSKDITQFLDEEVYAQEQPHRLTQFLDEEAYVAQPYGHYVTEFLDEEVYAEGHHHTTHGHKSNLITQFLDEDVYVDSANHRRAEHGHERDLVTEFLDEEAYVEHDIHTDGLITEFLDEDVLLSAVYSIPSFNQLGKAMPYPTKYSRKIRNPTQTWYPSKPDGQVELFGKVIVYLYGSEATCLGTSEQRHDLRSMKRQGLKMNRKTNWKVVQKTAGSSLLPSGTYISRLCDDDRSGITMRLGKDKEESGREGFMKRE